MQLKVVSALAVLLIVGCGSQPGVVGGRGSYITQDSRVNHALGYRVSPAQFASDQQFDQKLVTSVWVGLDDQSRPLPDTYFIADRYNGVDNNGTELGRYNVSFLLDGKVARGATHQYRDTDGAIRGFIKNTGTYLPSICSYPRANTYGRLYAAEALNYPYDIRPLCDGDVSLEYAGTMFLIRNAKSDAGQLLNVELREPGGSSQISFQALTDIESRFQKPKVK